MTDKVLTASALENMFSLPAFEHQLVMYVTSDDKAGFDDPFDIGKIPVVTREQADAEDRTKKLTATAPTLKAPTVNPAKAPSSGAEAAASASAEAQRYTEELMRIPEMNDFGSVLKSSLLLELTEAETEYVVTVVKHIFKEHIVLQYEVKNTLPDTVLENVSVVATPAEDEELEEVFIIQAERLPTNEPGKVYVAFKKAAGEGSMPVSSFSNSLKFTSKEIDPSTNEPEESGYDDEYEVSEFELTGSDYIIPTYASNFNHLWEQIGASGDQAEETLQLSGLKSIAGKCSDQTAERTRTDQLDRRNGTAGQDAVAAAPGRNRRTRQPEHAHAQAPRQDGRWRQGGGDGKDGLLVEVGRDDEDYGAQRGGERGGLGGGIRSIKAVTSALAGSLVGCRVSPVRKFEPDLSACGAL